MCKFTEDPADPIDAKEKEVQLAVWIRWIGVEEEHLSLNLMYR